MSLPNGTARLASFFAPLAALACGLAADEAHAAPITTQITYSTSGVDVSRDPSLPVLYEFRPVTTGVAALGSEVKLGTILVHRQGPTQAMPVLGTPFPIQFRVTKVGDDPTPAGGGSVRIDNYINDHVRNDGTVVGNLEQFINGDRASIQIGSLGLTLKPIAAIPAWSQSTDQATVEVEVFARLEGVPVPEPSVLLVFAAAAGFGWKRLGSRKSHRS